VNLLFFLILWCYLESYDSTLQNVLYIKKKKNYYALDVIIACFVFNIKYVCNFAVQNVKIVQGRY